MTEDIFILDCHSCVFVWVGQRVDTKIRAQALNIGEVYDTFIFSLYRALQTRSLFFPQNLKWIVKLCFVAEISRTWHSNGECISRNTTLCHHRRLWTPIFHQVLQLGFSKISSKHSLLDYSGFGIMQISRAKLMLLPCEFFQMHGNSFERRLSIVKDGVKPRADVRFLYPVMIIILLDSWDHRCGWLDQHVQSKIGLNKIKTKWNKAK